MLRLSVDVTCLLDDLCIFIAIDIAHIAHGEAVCIVC